MGYTMAGLSWTQSPDSWTRQFPLHAYGYMMVHDSKKIESLSQARMKQKEHMEKSDKSLPLTCSCRLCYHVMLTYADMWIHVWTTKASLRAVQCEGIHSGTGHNYEWTNSLTRENLCLPAIEKLRRRSMELKAKLCPL